MDDDEKLPKTLDRRIYLPCVLSLFFLALFYVRSTAVAEIDLFTPGLVLIGMFFAAFVLESRYVVWFGVLPNLLLLFIITESEWRNVPFFLKAYIIVGFFLGLLSFIGFYGRVLGPGKTTVYGNKHPLYKATYVLYSLKTILPFYFSYFMLKSYSHPFFMYSFLVLFIMIWFFFLIEGI
jgi:hypothetical protein